MKPGVKTSEFFVVVLGIIAGTAIALQGYPTEGSTVISASVASYGLARGLAKTSTPKASK